ncbi:MAG TPA: GNAT family N-acetyltransferase [Roseiflexaceae bacterium]|jgi:predicted N-acetyltransferase YhbS|nr:GNAT family N-acetyltransferase [Roseiflexaceae bacterium]
MIIRPATEADLPAILELAAERRKEYATYSPLFWRVAEDAAEQQAPFFRNQRIQNPHALTLVAEDDQRIVGFVMATIHAAPPVYNPGGPVCSIDDFTVATPDLWRTVGEELVRAAKKWARERGAVLIVVVAGQQDAAKRAMLAATGANVASEWWVQALDDETT